MMTILKGLVKYKLIETDMTINSLTGWIVMVASQCCLAVLPRSVAKSFELQGAANRFKK